MLLGAMFITNLWQDPYFFFGTAFLVIFSICCHEFMHAYTAMKAGDPTAADNGHLTLNPLKQMGVWSLVLFAFFGLAWGAVPVNPANFRKRFDGVKVALAGPLTNLFLALCFLLLTFFLVRSGSENGPAAGMIFYGSVLNIVLFILNMFPVPGFDGFAVLETLFPKLGKWQSEGATIAMFVIMILLFSSISYLFAFAQYIMRFSLMTLLEVAG